MIPQGFFADAIYSYFRGRRNKMRQARLARRNVAKSRVSGSGGGCGCCCCCPGQNITGFNVSIHFGSEGDCPWSDIALTMTHYKEGVGPCSPPFNDNPCGYWYGCTGIDSNLRRPPPVCFWVAMVCGLSQVVIQAGCPEATCSPCSFSGGEAPWVYQITTSCHPFYVFLGPGDTPGPEVTCCGYPTPNATFTITAIYG
jgi:hypothetical protein